MPDKEVRAEDGEGSRKRRRDAEGNRRRLLVSARRLLGPGKPVSARDLAQHADVSVATLYRHFPTREDLVAAARDEQIRCCERVFAEAVADPDPARGIRAYVRHTFETQATDGPFVAAFRQPAPRPQQERYHRGLVSLVARARENGAVRPDLRPSDLLLLLSAGRGVSAPTLEDRAARTRRLADITLAGLGLDAR